MDENGSIVVGWLSKLVVLFAVLGFLAYDGATLVVANVGAADDAGVAASAAAERYKTTKNVQAAYDSAVEALAGKGDNVETETFQVAPDGSVSLVVDRTPTTLWVHRIGPLKKWTQVHQTGTGNPPS